MTELRTLEGSEETEDTEFQKKSEEAEFWKDKIDMMKEGNSQVSAVASSAIFASIALPQIQITMMIWQLPFGTPRILKQIAGWLLSIISFDFGQLSSPECSLDDTSPADLLFTSSWEHM